MTGQFHDQFNYNGKSMKLVGIDRTGLFNIDDCALVPFSTCKACWRGFLCIYNIKNNLLFLTGLWINLYDPLPIQGQML
ncbi:MAG: hypothetical protein K9W44_18235 [Candidatus Lokiarchaeota archaeon]|nr:hypothetical protein [Candidatus Harpocratesius repetitus]